MFRDHISECADAVIDAATILLLDKVVHFPLAGFFLRGGWVGGSERGERGRLQHGVGLCGVVDI